MKEKFLYITKSCKEWGKIHIAARADSKHVFCLVGWICNKKGVFKAENLTINITKENRKTWREKLFVLVCRELYGWLLFYMRANNLSKLPRPQWGHDLTEGDFAAKHWERGIE